jgi:predicted exporter
MAVCAVLVLRASFTADMSAFLPQAPTAEQRLLVDQLRDGLVSRLVLVGIEGADAPARAALSRKMAQALRQDKQFVAVANGETVGTERDQAFFFQNRYLLSPAVNAERFTAPGLNAAIQESLDLLASPAGLLVKDMLARDPTGEIAVVLDALSAQSASARNRPAVAEGVWASRDGRRALMLLQTRAPGGDTDAQQAAVAAVQAAFAQARGPGAGAESAKLVMAGPGVFGVQVRELIEREVKRLSLVGTALIVVLLLALYRSLPALVLGLLPVASGVLVAIAAVSLGFGTVHGLTLGFGTTLIGEAVDYSIYLFVQSRHAGADRSQWVRRFWPTVRLGVLTSIFGFGALLFSGFPGLAQLGLYSIAGLIAAALVTRFVLPHLLPASFTVRDISAPGRVLASVVARAGVLRWPALALIALSVAVIVVHRDRVWNHELAALSPVSAQDQALDQGLRADLGAPDVRFLVVIQAGTEDAVLAAAERAVTALQPLVRANVIGGVDSPSHLLPSLATQRSRQAAIPPTGELAARLSQATQGLPLRAERLGGFLEDAEKARTSRPVQLADLEGTATGVALGGMLMRREAAGGASAWSAILPLHGPRAEGGPAANIDPARVKAVLPAVDAGGATRTLFVDLKGEADALYSNYLREAGWLSLGGLVAIALVIAVALRSVRRMVGVMLPLAGTVAILVAALVLAGDRLTILHLVGLLLVFAVGSNYALFFSRGPGPEAADEGISPTTLASLLFANIAAVLGFGILALSQVPVLQAIGITVGPGAVLALVLAAVFAARPKRAP